MKIFTKKDQETEFEKKFTFLTISIGFMLLLAAIISYEAGHYFYNYYASFYDAGELAKEAMHVQVTYAVFNASFYIFPGLLASVGIALFTYAISLELWIWGCDFFKKTIAKREKK